MNWTPSLEVCAQTAHVLGGLCFVGWFAAFGWPQWTAIAALAGWVAVKEGGFDIVVERDSWLSSAFDGGMYFAGAGLGELVWWAVR